MKACFFVSCVNAVTTMLEIQQTNGKIWRKAISRNIVKLKKQSKLVNPNVDLDHQVMQEELKKDLKVNQK